MQDGAVMDELCSCCHL